MLRYVIPSVLGILYCGGRNSEGSTTVGWPDAGVILPDGTIDGVEATCGKDWQRHLEKDFKNAINSKYPKLAGYLFIAGSPTNVPAKKIAGYKNKFVKIGIPKDKVDIVIGTRLVSELAEPEFARVRHTILGLRNLSDYFSMSRIGVDTSERVGVFQPEPDEYGKGWVYRPELAGKVEVCLSKEGCALVRGRGASGKTVLARMITMGDKYSRLPSYYIDLSQFADRIDVYRGKIINEIGEFGGKDILFIVDNIHLAENAADQIYDEWKHTFTHEGTLLLLLGRETKNLRGYAFESDDLNPMILTARSKEVRGVFRRLALKHIESENDLPNPPENEVSKWVKTFGGPPENPETTVDLIAFSAAVTRRMNYLLESNWNLEEKDATAEIYKQYIEPLDNDETGNLLRLSACPDDFLLSKNALAKPHAEFNKSVKAGVIFETEHGKDKYVNYRLVHSALGPLFLAAAPIDVLKERILIAKADPFSGLVMASMLELDNQVDKIEVCKILQGVISVPNWYLKNTNIRYLKKNVEFIERMGIADSLDFDLQISSNFNELIIIALKTPLNFLVTFLRYTKNELPKVHEELAKGLCKVDKQKDLLTKSMESPFDALSCFLEYAENSLKDVYAYLQEQLAEENNIQNLVKKTYKTPLANFLSFIKIISFSSQLLELIDIKVWNLSRQNDKPQQPDFIIRLDKTLVELGHPELSGAPAKTLIKNINVDHWNSPGIGIHHFSHTIRLVDGVTPEQTNEFIEKVATQDWLARQYDIATTGGLAGALFAIFSYLDTEHHSKFCTEKLHERVKKEMRTFDSQAPEKQAQRLSLLGVAALLGMNTAGIIPNYIKENSINRIIAKRKSHSQDTSLQHLQAQLWIGLREMARLFPESMQIENCVGDDILSRWKVAETKTSHMAKLNQSMVTWLQSCATNNWKLID